MEGGGLRAKIRELDHALLVEQQVRALDVAMVDPEVVEVRDRGQQLRGTALNLGLRESLPIARDQQVVKRPPGAELYPGKARAWEKESERAKEERNGESIGDGREKEKGRAGSQGSGGGVSAGA